MRTKWDNICGTLLPMPGCLTLKLLNTTLYNTDTSHYLIVTSHSIVTAHLWNASFYGHFCCYCSVGQSCPTLCDPHGLQHARHPCPSPSPRACSNSCPLSRWCQPTISSSVIPFCCHQSFPASGSFLMNQLYASGGQSIELQLLKQNLNLPETLESLLQRRKWQPTPVFLPWESQGWGSLVGYRLWGCTESDTTEVTWQQQQQNLYWATDFF